MNPENVEYLVVHTAAFGKRNCDRDVIDSWHRQRGWSGIGYHYVIINDLHDRLEDGEVQQGRPTSKPGAHVKGVNSRSLGICCVGHGDQQPHTKAQRASLLKLLADLLDDYPNTSVDKVIGHREVNDLVAAGLVGREYKTAKTCPGTLVDMDEIRTQLKELRVTPSAPEAAEATAHEDEIRSALTALAGVPEDLFPNAYDELRAFITHPEVIDFRSPE